MKYWKRRVLFFLMIVVSSQPIGWAEEISKPVLRSNRQLNAELKFIQNHQPEEWHELNSNSSSPEQVPVPGDLQMKATFPQVEWWGQFKDPHMTRYIEDVYHANPDVIIAALRIQEQQAVVGKNLANQLPVLGIGGTYYRNENIVSSIGGGPSTDNPGVGGGFSSSNTTQRFVQVPLRLSYELDIWGLNATLTQAQRMERKALEAELDSTRLLLASELASTYFNLIQLDRLVAIEQQIIALEEKDLLSQTYQFKEGAVDIASVEEKKASLAYEREALQGYLQSQAEMIHRIATLRGLKPEEQPELPRASLLEIAVNPEIEAGFPSQLLRRRPDIRAAEMHFLGAKLNASAAKRALLPTFNGMAQLGFSSIKIGDLFSSKGLLDVLTGTVNQGLFEGGRKFAAIKGSKAKAEIAIHQYQKAILTAFKEVDDSFSKLKTDAVSLNEATGVLQAQEKQKTVMKYRLREGAVSGQQVIPIQLTVLKSEQQWAQMKCAVLVDRISLFKALGGGY